MSHEIKKVENTSIHKKSYYVKRNMLISKCELAVDNLERGLLDLDTRQCGMWSLEFCHYLREWYRFLKSLA